MSPTLLFSLLLVLVPNSPLAQTSQLSASSSQSNSAAETVIKSNGPVVAGFGNKLPDNVPAGEARIAKEVRHELLMLPYYSLFDDLEYIVRGATVTLTGSVTSIHSQTKRDAENAIKHIEGVEQVVDEIQVLPPSQFDDQIREQAYRRLVNAGGLSQYFWQAAPSIRIIVRNQNITLKGYVDREGDKTLAAITVKEIPNVFQVTDELQVIQ
jgi:hyperosmotically inducible periplasmic protein